MSLLKFIQYSLVVCLSIVGLSVNALPTTAHQETTESATTVTPEWIAERQQVITKAQASLEKAQAELPAEEQSLREKIVGLEATDNITENQLEEAANKRLEASKKVEELGLESQNIQTSLDKQQKEHTVLKATLEELTKYPRAELTVAHNQDIDEVEQATALQQQAVELEEQYLDIVKNQMALATKSTAFAIEWHIQLQAAYHQPMIKKQEETIAALQATVDSQQKALETALNKQPHKIANLKSVQVTVAELTKKLEQAVLDKDYAEVDVTNLVLERQNTEINLDNKRQIIKEQQDKLEELYKSTAEPAPAPIQEKMTLELENLINRLQKTQELEEQHLNLLNQRVEQAEKQSQLAVELHDKLQTVLSERNRLDFATYMQKEQQRNLARAAELRWELNKLPPSEEYSGELLKIQIQEANERTQQVERKLNAQHILEQLGNWQTVTAEPTVEFYQEQLNKIQGAMEAVDALSDEIQVMQELLQNKIAVLEKQLNLVSNRGEPLQGQQLNENQQAQGILANLKEILQQELDKIPLLQAKGQKTVLHLEDAYKEQLNLALLRQRQLPTNTAELQSLQGELEQVPLLFMQQAQFTGRDVIQAYQQTQLQRWYHIGIITLIWLFLIGIMLWLGRKIKSSLEERSLGAGILRMNALSITVFGVFLLLLWQTQPELLTITIILIFLLTWLGGKLLLNLFWLWLSELDPPETKLYRQLRWRIIVLGILTIITALVHVEPVGDMLSLSLATLDIIDSVYMILLSLMVLPLLRVRKVMLTRMRENMAIYSYLPISLISLLVPLVILAISILGLSGYISMGWNIVKQLSLFLLVLIGWLIAQGIMTDLMSYWKNSITEQSRISDIWREDFIPLMHKLLGVFLFIVALIILFWFTGWFSDVAIKDNIAQMFDLTLFTLGTGSQITLGDVLLSILIIWAVFSVAIGVGFGLQNIFSNFMSGISMGRPFRVGDVVKVGSFDGVKVVEMNWLNTRFMTANLNEVTIPNNTILGTSIQNYSSRKNVRLSHSVYVDPSHSPEKVKKVILEALLATDGILKESADVAPTVMFAGVNEWAAEYRAYFCPKDYFNSSSAMESMWEQILLYMNNASIQPAIRRAEILPDGQRAIPSGFVLLASQDENISV